MRSQNTTNLDTTTTFWSKVDVFENNVNRLIIKVRGDSSLSKIIKERPLIDSLLNEIESYFDERVT
jgi:hypothetical protein